MKRVLVFALLGALFACCCKGAAQRPVIGILSSPSDEADPSKGSFILSHYVQFLEGAGARVVPVLYDWPADVLSETLGRVNGVLFTGGGLSLRQGTAYFETARRIWDASQKSGAALPLWGTCMGFQLICVLAAENHSVLVEHGFDSEGVNLPLVWNAAAVKSSALFGTASPELINALGTQPITVNLHHDGVEPSAFDENKKLRERLVLLSTNQDKKSRWFVSTVEGQKGLAPVFATQWHPERPAFCWDPSENSTRDEAAIEAGQWVARRFIAAAKASTHAYESEDAVPLIEKGPSVRDAWETRFYFAAQL